MKPSNLLFVFGDQHRQCAMGCYGDEQVITPNFDRFAADGIRFDHCISNAPVCVPMRGSLLTGLHPWKHRALTNDLPADPACPSIARWLDAAGYETGYIGKWHLGGIPRDKAIPRDERLGFSFWKVANCNHTYDKGYYFDEDNARYEMKTFQSVTETDLALDFIQARASGERPWALFLSWSPPHEPFNAVPKAYLDRYDSDTLALRANVPSEFADRAREWLHAYYALITLLDDQFGRLTTALDTLGLVGNTLVVYTSDHGDLLGSHGLRNKQLPHEESVAVPLLARWPGRLSRGTRAQMNGVLDLPTTLGGLLGLPVPEGLDGADLSPCWRDANAPGPDGVLIHSLVPCHQAATRGDREWMGLRTERWTYARYVDGATYVLFDNALDPLQCNNLAADPAFSHECERLSGMLDRMLADAHYCFRPWPDMIREDGFLDEWNRSQRYFHRETLD